MSIVFVCEETGLTDDSEPKTRFQIVTSDWHGTHKLYMYVDDHEGNGQANTAMEWMS